MEAVQSDRPCIDLIIHEPKRHAFFSPDVMLNEELCTEVFESKRLDISEIRTPNGSQYVAYDPSLEREFGYPVNVMTKLVEAQDELSEALRKYERQIVINEEMEAWYRENIENASLTTRLKWVLTGVKG